MMLHGKNVLAVSSTVETITVNPVNISKEDKEKVARALSDIFETDYEKTLKKVLTQYYLDGIVLLVLETRANEQHKLRKTSEKSVDKEKQL